MDHPGSREYLDVKVYGPRVAGSRALLADMPNYGRRLPDFHHTIKVRQLNVTIDVHIHYSFEEDGEGTAVTRWLVLDVSMPIVFRPLRPAITSRFDKENLRTMAAVKQYAEAHAGEGDSSGVSQVLSIIPM
jgi:hypothetical protein